MRTNEEKISSLQGRQILINANTENTNIFASCNKTKAIIDNRCVRCNSITSAKLPDGKLYCRQCINIGRVMQGDLLVRIKAEKYPALKSALTWQGKLTDQQAAVSKQLVRSFNEQQNHLVWAVTGAGKTEMLFESINECLKQGKRVCIATPRIDVVNELYPRMRAAFSKIKIGKYHGKEYHSSENEQFIICTTHQLLKFYQAFDLLIIDEVDSFPYVDNQILHFAAKMAVKKISSLFYLSATPTEDLLDQVRKKQLKLSKLTRRFHGNLLPVPKEELYLRPFLKKKKLHSKLRKEINRMSKKHPLLVFVPRINQIDDYVSAIKKINSNLKISGVYAQDRRRLEKIEDFRNKKIDILVTTTILERGVTFKNVWVIIIAADDKIYQAANLVQIAGRVGRAADDPTGKIIFCYHKYTKQIKLATKQIREMNK